MSMYSRYNSITPSVVYGYERSRNLTNKQMGLRIRVLKEKETSNETLAFWGNAYPRIVN